MTLFTVGDVVNHHQGDMQCPECSERRPARCRCGGLVHASDATEGSARRGL